MTNKQIYWMYLIIRMIFTLMLFQMRGILNVMEYAEQTLDLVGKEMDEYQKIMDIKG